LANAIRYERDPHLLDMSATHMGPVKGLNIRHLSDISPTFLALEITVLSILNYERVPRRYIFGHP